MNDDERDAWSMHHAGADWKQIGREMGCTPSAAQSLASAYLPDTEDTDR